MEDIRQGSRQKLRNQAYLFVQETLPSELFRLLAHLGVNVRGDSEKHKKLHAQWMLKAIGD